MLTIRPAMPQDGAAYRQFFARLIADVDTMLMTPEEYASRTDAELADTFRRFASQDNHLFLLAFQGAQLAGFVSIAGGAAKKNWGCGFVVAGVDAAFRRQGVGRALFAAAEQWAQHTGLWRLELTVMAHNEPARQLYRQAGFMEEGLKRASLHWAGRTVDEVWMGKLLLAPVAA